MITRRLTWRAEKRRNRRMSLTRLLIAVLCASTITGCAMLKSDWNDDASADRPPIRLASPKLDSDSVSLDVAFISILADEEPAKPADSQQSASPKLERNAIDELWHWVDETAIAPEVRAALRLNGLRVGRVHTKSEFTRALNAVRRTPQDNAGRLLESAGVESNASQASRLIPCYLGKRTELPVNRPAPGEVATLVSLDGHTIGRTLASPQPLFAITIQSKDASSVRIRMQPEIQYGEMRQTWVSSDSAMRIDNRRDSWVMDQLAFELGAEQGGTIVAGASLPAYGLGEQMFTGQTADGYVDHVLVVIRVAELPNLMSTR